MTDIGQELGVQSFCFRHFKDNETVARQIREIGLSKVELCGVHFDIQDASQYDNVIGIYRDAGVEIPAVGVQYFNGDEQRERPYFEFAKRAGAKFMSVDFNLANLTDALRGAERLADQYDMRLAIHNHGGRHWLGSAAVIEWVLQQCSKRIGLCLDTAWALDSGENPVQMAEKFGDRLYGLHVKDFVFDSARHPEDVVVGTGNLDLPALYSVLDSIGFGGYAVLEYEGDVENPAPALKDCVAMARNA